MCGLDLEQIYPYRRIMMRMEKLILLFSVMARGMCKEARKVLLVWHSVIRLISLFRMLLFHRREAFNKFKYLASMSLEFYTLWLCRCNLRVFRKDALFYFGADTFANKKTSLLFTN